MWELAAIGLIGGVVTGISPCILPVLPVVLAVTTGERARPFRVVAGIALSFPPLPCWAPWCSVPSVYPQVFCAG